MDLTLTICAQNLQLEEKRSQEISAALQGFFEVTIHLSARSKHLGQCILIDQSLLESDAGKVFVNGILKRIDRSKQTLCLILNEDQGYPQLLREGKVDDIIIAPLRPLELVSKLRSLDQKQKWQEVMKMNQSFSDLIHQLKEDLELSERLQKAKLPRRFQDIKGFKVVSRYLAGLRSGGDYFDLAESRDGASLSVFLSDSSSYGLSGAVLSALMRVALKISTERGEKPGAIIELVGLIYDDLSLTLKETDSLSLFFGTFYRQDRIFRYLNLGNSVALYSKGQEEYKELKNHGGPLTRLSGYTAKFEDEIEMDLDGRLVIVSHGFINAVGGNADLRKVLNSLRSKDPVDSLNELTFRVKSKLTDKDDMPEKDCTALIMEGEATVLKLTK